MNLLFDLDGTLTDPFQGITKCISYALSQMNRQSPSLETLGWCIGPPLKNSLARLLDSDDEQLIEEALALYRERFGTIGLFENRVYEDIPKVLDTLNQMDHTLYVATSKPTVFAKRIIEHFNLKQYFSTIYGSELDGTYADKRHLISHILKQNAMATSGTVMIGDRKHDIIGAKTNGICGLGVLWGFGTREELEASGAYACISQPLHLVSNLVSIRAMADLSATTKCEST